MARLKERYNEEIREQLIERFGYSSAMQAPRLQKITLNMGVGDAKQDSKVLDAATEQLATIAGQQPSVRRARKSIAQFKVREGMPVGLSVTLRRERAYEFLDRLMTIAIPRIREPCSVRRVPTRVGFLSFGSSSATLETWTGPSRSITPTGAFGRAGFGF